MRKLFLSLAFLAGLGWPAVAGSQGPAGAASPAPLRAQASTLAQQQAPPAQPQQTPPQASAAPPQQAPGVNPTSICGYPIGAPANLPPASSGPVVYLIVTCFPKQDNKPVVEPQTYQYYIQLPRSRPSQNQWTPYDDKAEKTILDDFKRLWATDFLDDLSIETVDYRFANGVDGKIVVYNMEERERVKIVDYEGNKHVEQSKIEDKLKEDNVRIGIDSFIDQSTIAKVRKTVLDLEAEKGYEFATVTPQVTPIEGQPKTVHLTFKVDEGPKVKIRQIVFVGNKAISSSALRRQMKNNKQASWLSFITSSGAYLKAKYEEDADKITSYYRDQGYVAARVGEPELKYIEDSTDRTTRWVQMRIPISEGDRYKVASVKFDGNKVVKTEFLATMFKMKPGDWYSDKVIRKGLEKVQEVYGSIGYFEFTGYPDLAPAGQPPAGQGQPGSGQPGSGAPAAADGGSATADGTKPDTVAAGGADGARSGQAPQPNPGGTLSVGRKTGKPRISAFIKPTPSVDVTVRLQEGKQYFVHRITFEGNTTTRDNVVRREMRVYEGGVFNTEALKNSIKRINQLGYFKNLEGGKDMDVQKTPNADNQVDVTLKVQEQNRNQITFGAGVSQYEGFFGQLGFQTANFMGRGETFNVSLQVGSLAQLFQVGFTEPFLFGRNITGGVSLFKNRFDYVNQFTQASTGGNLTFGFPLGRGYTRMFMNYSYEHNTVSNVNAALLPYYQGNQYLEDLLLLSLSGNRVVSKVTPSVVYNTVDNPIFPNAGKRLTASVDLAGIGGDTNFYKPVVEGVWYIPIGGGPNRQARTAFGFRAQAQYLSPFTGAAAQLPIYEKVVLGGEYSVRGFDLRSIGPKSPGSTLVLGGNKSLLFNAEYQITIAGPVRLVLFADAGQVRDFGEPFSWKEPVVQTELVNPPLLYDPTALITLQPPGATPPATKQVTLGYYNAFKTSTGAEVRFFMPVLNVPFRLIFAWNPSRGGILDNSGQPQKAFTFRFAVGTTF